MLRSKSNPLCTDPVWCTDHYLCLRLVLGWVWREAGLQGRGRHRGLEQDRGRRGAPARQQGVQGEDVSIWYDCVSSSFCTFKVEGKHDEACIAMLNNFYGDGAVRSFFLKNCTKWCNLTGVPGVAWHRLLSQEVVHLRGQRQADGLCPHHQPGTRSEDIEERGEDEFEILKCLFSFFYIKLLLFCCLSALVLEGTWSQTLSEEPDNPESHLRHTQNTHSCEESQNSTFNKIIRVRIGHEQTAI